MTKLDGNIYRLSMTSPGDDGRCGTAQKYEADIDGTPLDLGDPVEGGSAFTKTIALPAGGTRITVKAVDEAGNPGHPALVQRAPEGGGFAPRRRGVAAAAPASGATRRTRRRSPGHA